LKQKLTKHQSENFKKLLIKCEHLRIDIRQHSYTLWSKPCWIASIF